MIWNLLVGAPDQIASLLIGSQGSATSLFADRLDTIFAAWRRPPPLTEAQYRQACRQSDFARLGPGPALARGAAPAARHGRRPAGRADRAGGAARARPDLRHLRPVRRQPRAVRRLAQGRGPVRAHAAVRGADRRRDHRDAVADAGLACRRRRTGRRFALTTTLFLRPRSIAR